MALDMQQQRAKFDPQAGGPQETTLVFNFPSRVGFAAAAINGFSIGYTEDDHHLLRTEINADVLSVNGATLLVKVIFSLHDNTGNFDDPFSGFVDVLAIVDRA